jgi:hypothetical protein
VESEFPSESSPAAETEISGDLNPVVKTNRGLGALGCSPATQRTTRAGISGGIESLEQRLRSGRSRRPNNLWAWREKKHRTEAKGAALGSGEKLEPGQLYESAKTKMEQEKWFRQRESFMRKSKPEQFWDEQVDKLWPVTKSKTDSS